MKEKLIATVAFTASDFEPHAFDVVRIIPPRVRKERSQDIHVRSRCGHSSAEAVLSALVGNLHCNKVAGVLEDLLRGGVTCSRLTCGHGYPSSRDDPIGW